MTTEADDAGRRLVELVVSLAGSVEGVAACRPASRELGVELVLEPPAAADADAAAAPETLALHLGDLLEETRDLEPAEREGRVRAFVAGRVTASRGLPGWEDARSRVFIALRPLGFFHSLRDDDVVARRALPMLAECVVLDLGVALTYVSARIVEAWGVEVDHLFDVARANVEVRLTHDLQPEGDDEPPTIYRVTSDDSYESSRLLSLAWLAKARGALGSDGLVCAVPDRDTLLLAVDFSPPVLLRLAELAERAFVASARRISPALYVFTPEGDLGPLELIDEHPLRARVRRGHVMLADVEYGMQKAAIDAALEGQEREVFLASFFAIERDGVVISYATWAEGVQALLPPVDLVAFTFAQEREPLLVPFEVVAAVAGSLLEEVAGLEPRRLRTLGFPDAAQLAQIAEHAVEL